MLPSAPALGIREPSRSDDALHASLPLPTATVSLKGPPRYAVQSIASVLSQAQTGHPLSSSWPTELCVSIEVGCIRKRKTIDSSHPLLHGRSCYSARRTSRLTSMCNQDNAFIDDPPWPSRPLGCRPCRLTEFVATHAIFASCPQQISLTLVLFNCSMLS